MSKVTIVAATFTCAFLLSYTAGRADIPVIDGSNLDQHTKIQGHTNKTKATQTSTSGNTKGIDCSVHQGSKNADAKDNASSPNQMGGDQAVQTYAGDAQTSGSDATLADDNLARGQTGDIAAQQSASAGDVKAGEAALQGLSGRIGSGDTIKGSYDQNSVIAIQNGMVINGIIRAANTWVQAINMSNLMAVQQQSSMAQVTANPSTTHCLAGTAGDGTPARPCTTKACETVSLQSTPDPGCIEVRYRDSLSNVVTYLLTIQDAVDFKNQGIQFN